MKQLYIIRHAKSSWDDPYLRDFDRPLNGRGKRNVPDMGKRLANLEVMPDLMISSPANRALTTAKGIAKAIGYDKSNIREAPDLYHASVQTIREVISQTTDEVNTLMIFGHNPGFTSFIGAASDFSIWNLPTCAICGIQFDFDSWSGILRSRGRKFYYDFPKSVLS